LREFEDLAGSDGIAVLEGNLPNGERGRWYAGQRIIVVQSGMPLAHTRSALSHELGHAKHDHDMSTPDARTHQFQERQANEYAARLLITEELYRRAERTHGAHLPAIAHELVVTAELVQVWQDLWLRKGNQWHDNSSPHKSKKSSSKRRSEARRLSDTN
jgi:Zn-dependent peptidase ImmA (M78 family)